MRCPHCKREINIGALLGSVSTPAKTEAARANGKLGGRPRKKKRQRQNSGIDKRDNTSKT